MMAALQAACPTITAGKVSTFLNQLIAYDSEAFCESRLKLMLYGLYKCSPIILVSLYTIRM